ncbi:MAG: glycosyl hydrolase family 28 protein, partial [Saprospiraceae bacterium]
MKVPVLLLLFVFLLNFMPEPQPRVFLIGDSTMANKRVGDAPETGWGQVLHEFFTEKIEIRNHAMNGQSTKSFRDKGYWKVVLEELKKDDYVIIQFGHNDAKAEDSTRSAPAQTVFRENLIQYIREIKNKGAFPILATPVFRRNFDEKGNLQDTHGDYPAVVKAVAKSQQVELLDLHAASSKVIQQHGVERSKWLFMHHGGGVFGKFPDGIADNTHFSPYGARCIAAAAAAELVQMRHPLRAYLKKSPHSQTFHYELPNVATPSFKKDTFSITDYGAVPGIGQLNTSAIQMAIDMANKNGGGVVLVPVGLWITGPIELKDNINLCVSEGALLQFSDDRNVYPIITTTWEGQEAYRCQAPISAKNCTNIALTGKGVIDGAGQVWKAVRRAKLTEAQWDDLVKSGGTHDGKTWYPSEQAKLGYATPWAQKRTEGKTLADYETVRDFLRPNFVSLIACNVVLIENLTFTNSPAWTLHPLMCQHTTVRNVRVLNPWFGQNNDAIDLESCQYGILENCFFDTGDDAITLKSGRDAEGRKRGIPTSNWIIRNMVVLHGHGGFVVGSEMSGGVHHIFVDNCTFSGTDIGLRFKTARGRGGTVSDIFISNIQMSKIVGEAILFSMYYAAKDPI